MKLTPKLKPAHPELVEGPLALSLSKVTAQLHALSNDLSKGMICILCSLFLLSLNAMAASKSVTAGQNITETGTAYNDATSHALSVTTGTYTGTNITLTTSSNTRYGVSETNQARVNLTNSSISTSSTNAHGVNLTGTSILTMTGGTITTGTTGAYGVNATTASQVNLQDTVINSYGNGVNLFTSSTANLLNTHITTAGTNAHGVSLSGTSVFAMTGGTITTSTTGAGGVVATTAGQVNLQDTVINSYAIGVNLTGATGTLNNVKITTKDTSSYGIQLATTSTGTLNNVNITTAGTNAHGVNLANTSTLTMTGGTITTGTTGAYGVNATTASQVNLQDVTINSYSRGVSLGGDSTGSLNNVNITTKDTSAYGVAIGTSSTATLLNTNITTAGTSAAGVSISSTSALTMTGGTITTGTTGAGGMAASISSQVNMQDVTVNSYKVGVQLNTSSTASLNNVNITTQETGAHGVYLITTSTATLNNTNITTTGSTSHGMSITGSSALTMTGGTITTGATGAVGVNVSTSQVNLKDTVINSYATGVSLTGASFFAMTGGTITTGTTGVVAQGSSQVNLKDTVINSYGMGILLTGISTGTFNNVNITTQNGVGMDIAITSTATITGGTITTNGSSGHGLIVEKNSIADISDVKITTYGDYARGFAINAYIQNGGTTTATVSNVQITTNGHDSSGIGVGCSTVSAGFIIDTNGYAILRMNNSTVSASGDGINFLPGISSTTSGVIINQRVELTDVAIDAQGIGISNRMVYIASPLNVDNWNEGTTTNNEVTLNRSTITGAEGLIMLSSKLSGTNAAGEEIPMDFFANMTVSASDSILQGDVLASGSKANLNLSLDNSTLTGSSTVNDNAVLDMNLSNGATWNMTGNSTLTNLNNNGIVDFRYNAGSFKTLTVNNNMDGTGVFKMNAMIGSDIMPNHAGDLSGAGDLIVISGTAAGDHQIIIKRQGGNALPNGEALQLMLVQSTQTTGTFHGSADVGMRSANVQRGDLNGNNTENWYLVLSATNSGTNGGGGDNGGGGGDNGGGNNNGGSTPTIGGGGHVVLASAKARSTAWFDQDTLVKRMGELRANADSGKLTADINTNHDWEAWVRSYGSQYNMGTKVTGYGNYEQTIYGVDLGADKAWNIDKRNVIYTGVFGGYERSDLDFKYNDSNGGMDGYNAGVYATWLHDTGWYADWVARAMYQNNDFKAHDNSTNSMNGSYDGWAAGTSIEFGRQFQFKDGWYAEPQVQASYVHFFGSNYNTTGDNAFGINVQDQDTLQIRFGSLLGRTIKLNENTQDRSFIQPYVKVFGVEQISDGGDVVTGDGRWRANLDGMSAIIGAGLIYQLDANNQLHLDYEAQFADKYDKPFGINFGYRHQF